ncbi:MAG: hypothetical protein HYT72_01525 [Candidatus Aenigmarchaeota archaeon]|nr:hypothetical protein [Candidatus Aenigmarchaeota archaeon]
MPLKLRDVKGRNYFSIWSKRVDAELRRIIQTARNGNLETAEELQQQLGSVIGFGNVSGLITPDMVVDAAQEEMERLRKHRQFLRRFRQASIAAGISQAEKEFPSFSAQRELELDAVYHSITRYGAFPAFFTHGSYKPDEDLAGTILSGRRLRGYMPAGMPSEMLDMLVLSMVDSATRISFFGRLRATGFSEHFIDQLENTLLWPEDENVAELVDLLKGVGNPDVRTDVYRFFLERRRFDKEWDAFCQEHGISGKSREFLTENLKTRHRRIGEAQPFRIASALRQLLRGNSQVLWVLDSKYLRNKKFLPLVKLVTEHVESLRLDVHPIHTRVVSTLGTFLQYFNGRHGSPQTLLNYLADLTGIDPYDHLYRWDVRGKDIPIIHPRAEISDAALGRLYGFMLARGSYVSTEGRWHYTLHNQDASVLTEMVDFGSLLRLPQVSETEAPFPEGFGGTRNYVSRSVAVPRQVSNIFETVAETMKRSFDENGRYTGTREFAVAALRAYVTAKGRPYNGRHSVYFPQGKDSPEQVIRRLAEAVGLKISDGSVQDNQRYSFVSGLEQIGLAVAVG